MISTHALHRINQPMQRWHGRDHTCNVVFRFISGFRRVGLLENNSIQIKDFWEPYIQVIMPISHSCGQGSLLHKCLFHSLRDCIALQCIDKSVMIWIVPTQRYVGYSWKLSLMWYFWSMECFSMSWYGWNDQKLYDIQVGANVCNLRGNESKSRKKQVCFVKFSSGGHNDVLYTDCLSLRANIDIGMSDEWEDIAHIFYKIWWTKLSLRHFIF